MRKIFLTILLSFLLISGFINDTNAYRKSELPKLLNSALQENFSEEKRISLLEKEKVINFINTKIKSLYINGFVYREIKNNTYNDNYIIKGENDTNYIKIKYNKYNLLDNNMLNKKKEQIREMIIKSMLDKEMLNIDNDVRQFDIEIDYKADIIVTKNDFNTNKKDIIKSYIDNMFAKELESLKVINTNKDIHSINKYFYL